MHSEPPVAILRRLVTLAQQLGAHSQVIEDSTVALDSLEEQNEAMLGHIKWLATLRETGHDRMVTLEQIIQSSRAFLEDSIPASEPK